MQQTKSGGDAYAVNFGASLRERRTARGMSQRELAERVARKGLRLDPTAVTRIERGERDVRLGEAIVLAWELDASLSEMWSRDPMTGYHEHEADVRRALITAREALVEALEHYAAVRTELRNLPDASKANEWTPDEWAGYMAREITSTTLGSFGPASTEEATGADALVSAVLAGLIQDGGSGEPR